MLGLSHLAAIAALVVSPGAALAAEGDETPRAITYSVTPPAPKAQTPEDAHAKSAGCLSCHTATDASTMHKNPAVVLGCTDCHGGNAQIEAKGVKASDSRYAQLTAQAHVLPRLPQTWHYPSSANPERSYTLLNKESPEYIRFVNPSDYRVAREACGACHQTVIQSSERSIMATGAMFWGGASYNNGIVPYKNYLLGEAYTRQGEPAKVDSVIPVDPKMKARGVLSSIYPLPAWETVPPADPFRIFERGGRNIVSQFPEIGLPDATGQLQRLEEPGRPDIRQSNRGPGTGIRVAIPVLNITKTRLNDPFTWFLGTNDQPGDYRTSGCGACHIVYANDRDPRHSGPYAAYGHDGTTRTVDPVVPKNEPGHPIRHEFTRAIPTSQCMICHMHQPNMFMNTFLGYTMWDYESDAPLMWPKQELNRSTAEQHTILERNPEYAAVRGSWGDPGFLSKVWTDVNPKAKDSQFADYHGHGWNFRAVYKRDRKGDLLDAEGAVVPNDAPNKFQRAVHLSSIHVDKGMQCVDCHLSQDGHGNGLLYGEVANAVEIGCKDCHGTAAGYPTLRTSNPAAPPQGTDLSLMRTPDGRRQFEWVGKELYQRSMVDPKLEWRVSLVKDTVNPDSPHYNAKAARAKLMAKGTSMAWSPSVSTKNLAHGDDTMTCYTCHTSWTTSCGGCHLPIEANWKTERHHYEGGISRNFATYNPQVARDEMFQLGRHSTSKGNLIAPVRSSSALVLSSTNINRERIYIQQPPISASGYSSQAFAPHYPHTERTVETKTCSDCHLSQGNDNNAIMAQLLLLGTNFVNFVGYNAWVGEQGGIEGVRVTEWDEPQAVLGSYLQRYAYPDRYQAHLNHGRELPEAYSQMGGPTGCIQLRGEYVLAAQGSRGTTAYDVASIANKGVSDRILSGPVSPLGQSLHISSTDATCVALPTNQPIHPDRNKGDLMRADNQEQPFHPIYNYAFITDRVEGLIATDVNTLADAEPRNNFMTRALTWNENGILSGARHLTIAGTWFFVAADAGLVVLDMDDPMRPKVASVLPLKDVRASAVQFRYLFALNGEGLQVVDISHPDRPRLIEGAMVPFKDARRIYVARTYAYIAAGAEGLAIVDVEQPEAPRLYQRFTAGDTITDASDVIVGTTNASLFAYVADGRNGLKVLQLTSPESQPNFYGFSPDPKPELIATRQTRWPALALSKGLDRDRAVDETGHQMAVFGRLGSRPFTKPEMDRLYLDGKGQPWFVTDRVDERRATAP